MIYQEWYLKTRWFDESAPTNKAKATGVLTFSGIPVVSQTVTIGSDVFEFVASAGDVQVGNIAVALGGTLTADNAVTVLTSEINAHSTKVVAVGSTTNDTVTLTAINYGDEQNSIATTETCSNASFAQTTLTGGCWSTPCPEVNTIVKDETYHYICTTQGNRDDCVWKRFTLATY